MLSTLRIKNLLDQFKLVNSLTFGNQGFNFSSAAAQVAQKNFISFRKQYEQHVSAFQQKVDELEKSNTKKSAKPTTSGYEHPYHSDHHPLNFSAVKLAEFFHDLVGPEQVSPHYENFMASRKYLLTFWAGFAVLNFGVATVDLHWIAKSAFIPWIFWFQILYFYIELRKSWAKPLLVRFYRRAAANECFIFESFYHENIENKLRELIRVTKGQLDYWDVHSSYNEIKAESVNNFLAVEYMNLQRHISNRAINILNQAQTYENANQNKILNKMVEDAISELDKGIKDQSGDLQKKMFESAIQGLSKGYMDYQNDPLLPLVIDSIKRNVQKVSSLSPTEQAKLVSLSAEQLKSLQESDDQAKKEYLNREPKGIDASLKNHDTVKKILDRWGD